MLADYGQKEQLSSKYPKMEITFGLHSTLRKWTMMLKNSIQASVHPAAQYTAASSSRQTG